MADGRSHPTCRKCGQQHYNFEPCPAPPVTAMRAREIVRQPRPGYRDWGKPKTRTVQVVQGAVTSVRHPREFTEAGRVTDSDGKPIGLPRLPAAKPTLTYPGGGENG